MNNFQKLVYTRLQSLPRDFIIAVGDYGEVTKDEALQHVQQDDEIGQFIIMVNREYFDMIKSGKLYENIG